MQTGSGSSQNEIRAARLDNLRRLKDLGYEPYGGAFERSGRLADVRAAFEEGKHVRIAGRLAAKREMGKSVFGHVQDGSDRFQVYVKKDVVGDKPFEGFTILDLGDHIGAEGDLFVTKTGEQTLRVTRWTLLSKALLPLPEKWHGLVDVETRFRKRYLDLIANPGVRELFNKRIEVVREIRAFLFDRGFLEVETPMMQPLAGGAAANPFKTRYEALGSEMFLRVAPELYLKRLLVGGFDKVFELNRNFRNEGLSRNHSPEFTMLEIYEAYGDVNSMKRLAQDLVTHVAQRIFGTLEVGSKERPIDLTPPWRTVTYKELVVQKAGDDWYGLPADKARGRARELGLDIPDDWSHVLTTQELFEKLVERDLVDPTFVTRFPVELVPLAKACADDPGAVDVFELIIGGSEIAPAYSELNDPVEQRRRLEEQARGDRSKVDEDFLTALEHGMPPAGGMGIGVDRLMVALTGADSLREVILFPQLRSKGE